MPFSMELIRKKLFSSASAARRKTEENYYLKNGSCVLEEFLALCDGNCRIPIRYFTAIEIENAIKHTKSKMVLYDVNMVTGSLDNRLVLVRFNRSSQFNIHRDIAVTAQMSHLKNVLRLIGCCLEYESPVMVYAYVEGTPLSDLLFEKSNQTRKSLSWGNRLRVACDVASAIVFLHTEFTTPIIHRDIQPYKVIIDENSGVAKIVDFSYSISLPPGELEVKDRLRGSIGYLVPEYVVLGVITQKTDVYSFGVLLFQLLTGKTMPNIVMDKVNSAISEDTIDFDIKMNNAMDSTISKETIDFEEDATEEGNTLDRVDSVILDETIEFKNLPTNFVDRYTKEGNVMDIADPTILEEHGIEIQQQLKDYLNLVKKCTADNGDDRPYMIHVARELRRIEKCFKN